MSNDVFTLADLDRIMTKMRAAGCRPLHLWSDDEYISIPIKELSPMSDPTASALASNERAKPIDRVQIIVGNGQPIAVVTNNFQVTCPTCSRVFPVDVLDEGSARDDVRDFETHTAQCLAAKTVPAEGGERINAG